METPNASVPIKGAVEIGSVDEAPVLIVGEHISQVGISSCPTGSLYIGISIAVKKIVKVNLIDSLALHIVKSQFVGHFVGEEQSFVSCLFVTHGICRERHGKGY